MNDEELWQACAMQAEVGEHAVIAVFSQVEEDGQVRAAAAHAPSCRPSRRIRMSSQPFAASPRVSGKRRCWSLSITSGTSVTTIPPRMSQCARRLEAQRRRRVLGTPGTSLSIVCVAQKEIHLEAFQCSKQAVQLWSDGWIVEPASEGDVSSVSSMRNPQDVSVALPVMIAGKDVAEVDNDFFLVPVAVRDHEAPLLTSFAIENRLTGQVRAHAALDGRRRRPRHLAE